MKTLKTALSLLLVAVMAFSLVACKQQPAAVATTQPAPTTTTAPPATEPPVEPENTKVVFPEGTKILDTDVSGLNPEEAYNLVSSVLAAYSMTATVNNKTFQITAEDVRMQVTQEEITAYAQALEKGTVNPKAPELTIDSALLRQRIAAGTGSSVEEAKVVYNKSKQAFEITPDKAGVQVDTVAAAQQIEPALLKMEARASAQVEVSETEPTMKADDPVIKNAAAKANAYLKISLTYIYAPDKEEARSQAVSKNDIGGMISFDGAMNPYVNTNAVNNYAVKMNEKYCVRGKYTAPDGTTIDKGPIVQAVDTQALAADLKNCLENGISGTRNAPYGDRVEQEEGQIADCVVVNLTAQHLYVYNSVGALVVSTPIVSGCVYNDTETITGTFHIYAKSRNVTLTGPGYASPVKYWMPFSGGYGLHDANWRSNFGPEEYLYNGSHGCVNIPPAVAGQVYDNVSVGTTVIIFGGATTVKERPQNLTGKTNYLVPVGAESFDLGISYLGEPVLTYTSADTSVVQVSADGKVTVVGKGKTTITVEAPEHVSKDSNGRDITFMAGTLIINITVAEDCGAGHNMEWETTKDPTCGEGEQKGICTACGHTEIRKVQPLEGVEHTYGEPQITKEPGCTTEGVLSSTCTVCGNVKAETIPATGHSYENGTCTGCGAEDPAAIKPDDPEQTTP